MARALSASAEDQTILERAPVAALLERVTDAIRVGESGVEIMDADRLRAAAIDELARAAVFGEDEDVRDTARWLIGEAGAAVGIVPASIHELYLARGRGEAGGFTVPAMNIRAASFDSGRA
ncbi:MAG TPA: hypothetical protein VMN39_05060, partial [Longimicrobiaceae bacterium]|nr:hypothetical protein [Longimicrobiaceae bacterium]